MTELTESAKVLAQCRIDVIREKGEYFVNSTRLREYFDVKIDKEQGCIVLYEKGTLGNRKRSNRKACT